MTNFMVVVLLFLSAQIAHAADATERTSVAVMDIAAEQGISEGTRKLLTELLLTRVQAGERFQVFGSADMQAMLSLVGVSHRSRQYTKQ